LAKITADRWADLLKTSSVSEQENAEKQADFKLKTATVDAARANVHRLEELVSFARVTAPFAGTITARNTDVAISSWRAAARNSSGSRKPRHSGCTCACRKQPPTASPRPVGGDDDS